MVRWHRHRWFRFFQLLIYGVRKSPAEILPSGPPSIRRRGAAAGDSDIPAGHHRGTPDSVELKTISARRPAAPKNQQSEPRLADGIQQTPLHCQGMFQSSAADQNCRPALGPGTHDPDAVESTTAHASDLLQSRT